MTSKKKQEWEENLPNREKYLRINMRVLRASIKEEKLALKYVDNDEKDKIKKCINAQNVIIRAMKHELERGGSCKAIFQHLRCNAWLPDLPVYQCSACRIRFWDDKKYSYCPNCGRKIKE